MLNHDICTISSVVAARFSDKYCASGRCFNSSADRGAKVYSRAVLAVKSLGTDARCRSDEESGKAVRL